MTTIVYSKRENKIAFDSRLSTDDIVICDDFDKSVFKEDNFFVGTGCVDDIERLIQHYLNEDTETEKSLECTVMAHNYKYSTLKIIFEDNKNIEVESVVYDRAIGSGRDFALAAIDLTGSVETAIRQAAKRDLKTGGTARIYDLDMGQIIKKFKL